MLASVASCLSLDRELVKVGSDETVAVCTPAHRRFVGSGMCEVAGVTGANNRHYSSAEMIHPSGSFKQISIPNSVIAELALRTTWL